MDVEKFSLPMRTGGVSSGSQPTAGRASPTPRSRPTAAASSPPATITTAASGPTGPSARLRRACLGAVPTGHEPAGFAGVVRAPPDRADVAAVDVDSDGRPPLRSPRPRRTRAAIKLLDALSAPWTLVDVPWTPREPAGVSPENVFGAFPFAADCHWLRPLCSINAPPAVVREDNTQAVRRRPRPPRC